LHVPAELLTDEVAARFPAWSRLLTDVAKQYQAARVPEQDPTARFPGKPLRRHSETTFTRCVFASCRRPASQCHQDHRREHAKGGRTEPDNLQPLCAHD